MYYERFENEDFREAIKALETFAEDGKEVKQRLAEIGTKYQGSYRVEKENAVFAGFKVLQVTAMEKLQKVYALFEAKIKACDHVAIRKLTPEEALTSDYDYLDLPVVLTVEQLQILADRNRKDSLFLQAVSQYAAKHHPDENTGFLPGDGSFLDTEPAAKQLARAYSSFKTGTSDIFDNGGTDHNLSEVAESVRWTLGACIDHLTAAESAYIRF